MAPDVAPSNTPNASPAERGDQYRQAENGSRGVHHHPHQPSKPKRMDGCKPTNGAEGFSRTWQVGLIESMTANPGACLAGSFCAPCYAMAQRKKLLHDKMENYKCCAGMCGSCFDSCTEPCPVACLCLEAFLCLSCAVHGNRWIIQSMYGLQNTWFDIFLMWLSCLCGIVGCLMDCDELSYAADIIYYAVIGCMQAQQDHELKFHNFPHGPGPVQHQME